MKGRQAELATDALPAFLADVQEEQQLAIPLRTQVGQDLSDENGPLGRKEPVERARLRVRAVELVEAVLGLSRR